MLFNIIVNKIAVSAYTYSLEKKIAQFNEIMNSNICIRQNFISLIISSLLQTHTDVRIFKFEIYNKSISPTDLIWRKGTPFEAMIGRTAPSSDGLLAEVFWGFPRL